MRRALILVLLILLTAGMAEAHRMFVGQRVSLEIFAIYDDGEPARNADVMVYRLNATTQDYDLYQEGVTDSQGIYMMTLPGKGTGQWRYAISGHGHSEEGFIGVSSDRPSSPDGKLLTLAILPLALIAWRVKKR
ncbi:MAG: hypothetical protein WBK88_00470 [Methanothrix sp.]